VRPYGAGGKGEGKGGERGKEGVRLRVKSRLQGKRGLARTLGR
jgi:hypothetical protein